MATITWYGVDDDYSLANVDFGNVSYASSYARSSSKYIVTYPDKANDTFYGSSFKYSGTTLTSGTVTTYYGYDQGDLSVTIRGLKLSASAVGKVAKTTTILDDHALLKSALSGDDRISGRHGNDIIEGFGGDDTIYGGRGADILSGGSGADTFVFKSRYDSGSSTETADTIIGFGSSDVINFRAIDANAKTSVGNAFDFIGEEAFTKTAGELRFTKFRSETVLEGDVNGDGKADLTIIFDARLHLKDDYFLL